MPNKKIHSAYKDHPLLFDPDAAVVAMASMKSNLGKINVSAVLCPSCRLFTWVVNFTIMSGASIVHRWTRSDLGGA